MLNARHDGLAERTRRDDLIAATQDLVAEGGPQAATVRAIAERAGVTAGLIRHYFGSKDALLHAAYAALMESMTDRSAEAEATVSAEPGERLAAFIAAALRPPVVDSMTVGLWAGFLNRARMDTGLMAQHRAGYLRYRDHLQELIEALVPDRSPERLRSEAIACNAVIDGLWLEGSLLPDDFTRGELVRIALRSIGAIIESDLMQHATFVPEIAWES